MNPLQYSPALKLILSTVFSLSSLFDPRPCARPMLKLILSTVFSLSSLFDPRPCARPTVKPPRGAGAGMSHQCSAEPPEGPLPAYALYTPIYVF